MDLNHIEIDQPLETTTSTPTTNYNNYYTPNETPPSTIKQICTHLINFIYNQPPSPPTTTINGDFIYNQGWCTEPQTLHIALTTQQRRAEGRLYSLKTLYELLRRFDVCYLSCIHQHLLAGCFSLCNVRVDEGCTQLHHYLEGIQAAAGDLQMEIQGVVHRLYDFLIACLLEGGCDGRKGLQLLLVFALSTRYRPKDLDLVVKNGLMGVLLRFATGCSFKSGCVLTRKDLLAITALRLMRIVTLATCLYANCVGFTVLELVVDTLYVQLLQMTEDGVGDRVLGDFLIFLRTLLNDSTVKFFATTKWIVVFLTIINVRCGASNYTTQNYGLRPKLLTLQLLQTILIHTNCLDGDFMQFIVQEIFEQMFDEIANAQKPNQIDRENENAATTQLGNSPLSLHDMSFNSERCVNCLIESGLTVYHGLGGRGYALGNRAIKTGCYQWKILIVKEDKGNEGTCIGVSKYPVQDFNHRTTGDMWLYRAYSGSLYHKGEWDVSFQSYTQGDYITVVLDMDARTLSFGKNGDEPKVAFEDIDANELYPCVMFYSTKPGEKVKITDMQVCVIIFYIIICIFIFIYLFNLFPTHTEIVQNENIFYYNIYRRKE